MSPPGGSWLVLGKYLLFQLPSWAVVGALAWGARGWLGLPDWAAVGLLGALMVKDAVLFPFVRHAYAVEMRDAAAHLVGARGRVERSDARETWVRVGPELWRARPVGGGGALAPGTRVEVVSLEGFTLRVRPESGERAET